MPSETERSGIKTILVVIVAISVGTVSFAWFRYNRAIVSTDDAQIDGHIVSIAPKVGGRVIDVPVSSNHEVRKGQVLARIDPAEYEIAVAKARAELAMYESKARATGLAVPIAKATTLSANDMTSAGVNAAEAAFREAEGAYEQARDSELGYARASLNVRQALADQAQADLTRMRSLYDRAEISGSKFDEYVAVARIAGSEVAAARSRLAAAEMDARSKRAALESARAQIDGARAALAGSRAAEKQVPMRIADTAAAQAEVGQARARLVAAKLDLSYTTITAPIFGIVARKSVEVGQFLEAGQQMMLLVPLTDAFVIARFKETQLSAVHPGQRAKVRVDMYGKTLSARVESISAATESKFSLLPPENASGNFMKVTQRTPVKIVFDPPPPRDLILRPGMSVRATILMR